MALLFKVTGGWEQLLDFLEKKFFLPVFSGLGLKCIFH